MSYVYRVESWDLNIWELETLQKLIRNSIMVFMNLIISVRLKHKN